MRQTLLQLTEELVETLDRRAARQGVSRSHLVRALLDAALRADGEYDRALIDGYSRIPQTDGADEWGDLNAWTDANSSLNLAALNGEDGGW